MDRLLICIYFVVRMSYPFWWKSIMTSVKKLDKLKKDIMLLRFLNS